MSGNEPQAVGVVLAGGASRRMGRDKATLRLGGEGLAAAAVRRLAAVTAEVVVADAGRGVVPGAVSVADGAGAGPVAGLLGAAVARPERVLLVLACDLPGVTPALLAALLDSAAGDAVVPRWERGIEPLCALYRPAALSVLARRVGEGERALHRLLATAGLAVRWLDGEALRSCGTPGRLFRNVNRPEDLDGIEQV